MKKACAVIIGLGGLLVFAGSVMEGTRNGWTMGEPASVLIVIGPVAMFWGLWLWLVGRSSHRE